MTGGETDVCVLAAVMELASTDVVEIRRADGVSRRCRRRWPSDLSAKVELRDFNPGRERIR